MRRPMREACCDEGLSVVPLQRFGHRCDIPNFCTVKDSSGDLGRQASLMPTDRVEALRSALGDLTAMYLI